jgi:hypothetical protein
LVKVYVLGSSDHVICICVFILGTN